MTAPDDVTEDASLASNEPAVEHDRAEFPDPVVEAAQPQEKVETDHEPESIQFAPIAVEESAPSKRLAQFESEYIYGDDDFDSSFSVDSESREFLGEVGMGTSDLLAADDVQKVDAFEVWLFDKQEIVTKSKFVVSDYALQHEGLRSVLEAKGDLVPARVGEQIVLEAGLLRLVATIRDLHYQPDEQFPDGVFAHLKVDLAVDLIG